jgi:hypothetical protein
MAQSKSKVDPRLLKAAKEQEAISRMHKFNNMMIQTGHSQRLAASEEKKEVAKRKKKK